MPTPVLTERFNPHPDKPYATCVNCGVILDDDDAVIAHTRATMTPAPPTKDLPGDLNQRSHTIRTTNATRERRIGYVVENIVEEALREDGDMNGRELDFNEDTDMHIADRVDYLIRRRDITRTEAETALRNADANHITTALSEGDDDE